MKLPSPKLTRRHVVLASAAGIAGLGGSIFLSGSQAQAAPAARLIPGPWGETGGSGSVDHRLWGEFLAEWVRRGADGVNRVGYGSIDSRSKGKLKAYLDALQGVTPADLSRDEQMAFWVNLYNAATVDLVVEHWPVKSIRSIHGGFFNRGPWDVPLFSVAGRELTLNNVEHGILRPIWRDHRIHYVVNCASIGCPDLLDRPFDVSVLSKAERAYVNHPRGVRVDARGRVVASSIYHWYGSDFGPDEAAVVAYFRTQARPELKARLEGKDAVYDYVYDWDVNVWDVNARR